MSRFVPTTFTVRAATGLLLSIHGLGQPDGLEWDRVATEDAGMQIGSPQHQAATQRLARLEERLQLETAIKDLPPLRQDYIREVDGLKDTAAALRAAGKSPKEIARALYQARRDIGIKFKDMTPGDELAKIHARNLEKYGDKLGPSIDYLRGKRKSWEDIIECATRSGGADLGLGKK